MKLKTSTIFLAIAAIVIGGGWVYWDLRQPQSQADPQTQKANLFSFKEDDVVQLTVSPKAGTLLTFERTAESFPNTWKMVTPKTVVADEAAIAFLLDQLASSKQQDTVTIEKTQWADFGIAPENPSATVELSNGTIHRLILGGETFDKKNLYALVDAPQPLPDSVQVSVVSATLMDALQRPIAEWEYEASTHN